MEPFQIISGWSSVGKPSSLGETLTYINHNVLTGYCKALGVDCSQCDFKNEHEEDQIIRVKHFANCLSFFKISLSFFPVISPNTAHIFRLVLCGSEKQTNKVIKMF